MVASVSAWSCSALFDFEGFANGPAPGTSNDAQVEDSAETDLGDAQVCDTPDPPVCVSANRVRAYRVPGALVDGTCAYQPEEGECPYGCDAGACQMPEACTTERFGSECYGDPSMSVDSSGGVHIVCAMPYSVEYAYKPKDGAWDTSDVEPPDSYSWDSASVAVHGEQVHLAYTSPRGESSALRYRHKPLDGTWTKVDLPAESPGGVVLDVDAAGGIHMVYQDIGVMYRKKTGETWGNAEGLGEGVQPSLDVDASGAVHVAYYKGSDSSLRYAKRDPGGEWHHSTVESEYNVGNSPSLALDQLGAVHIGHVDRSDDPVSVVKYAFTSNGVDWIHTAVDNDSDYVALAVDAVGGVYLTYVGSNEARFAYKARVGDWRKRQLEVLTDARCAVEVDAVGGVHIACGSYGQMGYVYCPAAP